MYLRCIEDLIAQTTFRGGLGHVATFFQQYECNCILARSPSFSKLVKFFPDVASFSSLYLLQSEHDVDDNKVSLM